MAKFIPVLIACGTGIVLLVAFFAPSLRFMSETAEDWFTVLAAVAFLLGGLNLFLHQVSLIRRGEAGWGYAAVTLAAFLVTVAAGLFKLGCGPSPSFPNSPWSGSYQAEGGLLWWLFQYVLYPIVATMFSLLAFFVASAAFRAFRARNFESILLLGTALIVLLGRTYAGAWLTRDMPEYASFPGLTVLIMAVFNTAGQRAIMIGIALGVAATSMRILMGLDRSYLGSDD